MNNVITKVDAVDMIFIIHDLLNSKEHEMDCDITFGKHEDADGCRVYISFCRYLVEKIMEHPNENPHPDYDCEFDETDYKKDDMLRFVLKIIIHLESIAFDGYYDCGYEATRQLSFLKSDIIRASERID